MAPQRLRTPSCCFFLMKLKGAQTKSLTYYVRAFSRLRANPRRDGPSPHKPVLLLAVIESFEADEIVENRIAFSPRLIQRFAAIFAAVRRDNDRCNPALPFFHLQSSGFWHLKAKHGMDRAIEVVRQIKAQSQMQELVEYAFLDEELFMLLTNRPTRAVLRQTLLDRWFAGPEAQTLESVLTVERATTEYQHFIQERVEGLALQEAPPEVDSKARSEAFRRVVREAYDLRCAASGLRLILPDGKPLVESVHLVPFAETFDDDPRNGMALSPTFHTLLDAKVIAPGPDLKWHVSPLLDARIPDHRQVCELARKQVLLPQDRRYYPRKDALEWRMHHLAR